MQILSPQIQEFLREVKELNAIGCILVPSSDLDKLLASFKKALVLIGPEVQKGRVTYYIRRAGEALGGLVKPAVLIVTEEDYSADSDWAEKIRDLAPYFLNVKV